jgi:hypothetical protein
MTNDPKECSACSLCDVAKVKFDEIDKRWVAHFASLQAAINKSESILAIRLEEMNNFRRQIQEERMSYTTRRETVLLNCVISILVAALAVFITHLVSR